MNSKAISDDELGMAFLFSQLFYTNSFYDIIRYSAYRICKKERRYMFEPKVKTEQTDWLVEAVLSLDNSEDAYRFFEDIFTISEFKSIAQRLAVAMMLRKKETYHEIAKKTGASTATISRVNRALSYGVDGYNRVLDKHEEEK